MMPIRFACRFLCLLLLFLLGAAVAGWVEARPLGSMGVEDFRTLLDTKRDRELDLATAPSLAEYRRKLRQAAKDLPSLGEVTRVLLLSEWTSYEGGLGSPAPPDQVRKAVRQASDDGFKKDVRKLMASYPDPFERHEVNRAIASEIKRDVHQQLLERLGNRLHFFLMEGRSEDRIAASNLIRDTMATSRRQDVSMFQPPGAKFAVPAVMRSSLSDVSPVTLALRQSLYKLNGELEKLLADSNPRVQAAAIHALSDLEKEPADLVVLLKPLLTSSQNNVLTRRAAAEGLGHVLEVRMSSMDRDRPQPYLRGVQQVLPVAAEGLTDSDVGVRRASLEACQRAALVLNELANAPLALDRRIVFRPTLAVVEQLLSKLNAAARDEVPAVRIGACRVLETLAMTIQKMKRQNEQFLPGLPDPSKPEMMPDKEGDKNKSLSPPPRPRRGGKQSSAPRSLQWATVRADRMPVNPMPVPVSLAPVSGRESAAPDVALGRPTKLPAPQASQARAANVSRSGDTQILVRTAAFLAQPADELPAPLPVDPAIQETVQTMIDAMKHPDYRVRLAAVDTLETFKARAETAIPALVAALRDYNKFVRWSSARTLGKLAPRRASEVVPGLMAMLDDREDPSVRITAAKALELYGEYAKQAVPLLARVINRGDKEYVLAILHTIQGIGTDAAPALPNVAWILRDRTQPLSVRIEAAHTLGRFGALARGQLPTLREIMNNDPDESARNAASAAVLAVDRPE